VGATDWLAADAMNTVRPRVTVLLYPGCIFFAIAAAVELLARSCELAYCTPDGTAHAASNGARHWAHVPFAAAVACSLGVLSPDEAARYLQRQRFTYGAPA
jgi:hypothetical protein